ncbi:hypothetical protein [Sphingobium sp. HDIP04]|uniref:hypothetical protein n=1 Tax=Sphingobium sp. HDIP04 TaxID=428994 RepID=UPI001267A55E|nr:hypothetical protein [Sphingobium sp. HDIP04]
MGIPLFDGDFTQNVEPGSAALAIRIDALANLHASARALRWAGAGITLYAVDPAASLNAAGSYDLPSLAGAMIFKGKISEFGKEGNALTLTAEVDQEPFQKDVLQLAYAGTGDAEGGEDLKGRLKPWIFGRALNVEPVPISTVDNVFQFSAYAIQGISALYERGASLGSSIGNYATYAQLVAADIPNGRWATCHALGMARLGAPPAGVITGDVDGDNGGGFLRKTGAIVQRIAAVLGISSSLVDAASWDALDAAVPYNVNIVITEQSSLLDLARRMARPCNAQAGVDLVGRLFAVRPTFAAPSLTLDCQGRRLPPVRRCSEADVSAPYKRIMFGAARSWRVHTFDEIAFDAPLIDCGEYSPTTVYRRGNIVSLPNGSRWLYASDTPHAGSGPGDDNPDWEKLFGPITAGNITYEDGTPVEDLKPAEPNATHGATPEQMEQIAAPNITLSRPTVTLWAYENGIVTDFSNANGLVKVMSGGVDVTASAALSATATGCTGTINTTTASPVAGQPKGYYRVTAMSGDAAKLTLTAVYGGKTVTSEFQLTKIKAGYEIVASTLPTTNLFEGRLVYRESDGKLYRYKSGAWTAAINGADIDNATLTTAKFAAGIEPIALVGPTLPVVKSTNTVFNTSDGKLYRWNGSAYVATVAAGDVIGKIVGTQIDDNSIQTPHLAAGAVVASKMSIIPNNMCADPFFEDMSYWNYRVDQQSAWAYLNETGWASVAMNVPRAINIGGPQSERIHIGTGLQKCDSQGETFWLRAHGRNTTPTSGTGTILRCAVWFYGGDPLTIIGQAQVDFAPGTPNAGEIKSTKFTFPANCIYYRIAIYNGEAWAATGNLSISAIRLQKAADASLIVEGAVLAEHLGADSVTAGKVAAAAINTRELAANSVRANQMAIMPDNMCPDPYFDDAGLNGYWSSIESGWVLREPNGTNAATVMATPRVAEVGPGAASRRHITSIRKKINGADGLTYNFRVRGRNTAPSGSSVLRVAVQFYDEAGTYITQANIDFAPGENTTKSRQFTFPANCHSYHLRAYNDVAFASGYMAFTACKLEVAASAELIVDGDILARHLASNSVTTDKLDAGAVTAAKISVTSLAAISANLGNVAISGNLVVDGTITTGKITNNAVNKTVYSQLSNPGYDVFKGVNTGSGYAVYSTTFAKDEGSSALEFEASVSLLPNGNASPTMWIRIYIDGTQHWFRRHDMTMAGSGSAFISFRYRVSGLSAGNHICSFNFEFFGPNDGSKVVLGEGTNFQITEVKK